MKKILNKPRWQAHLILEMATSEELGHFRWLYIAMARARKREDFIEWQCLSQQEIALIEKLNYRFKYKNLEDKGERDG